MRELAKSILKPLFRYAGFEVTSVRAVPQPPPLYENLEKVINFNRIGVQASYDCPLDQCLTVNGFSLSESGWHPFVEALQEVFSGSGNSEYKGSFLERYYKTWTPFSSRDTFVGFENAPEILESIEPFAIHAPWMTTSPRDRQLLMERIILEENRVAGYGELAANNGYGLHGPVSDKKGETELRRLIEIYKSLEANSYDRTRGSGDVTVTGIEYNGHFRFCVMHGQHRVAAMAALGIETVPVKIVRIVHYAESCHWPQVYRGFWDQAQAQALVRHLFTFDSKAWARKLELIL